MSNIYVQEGAGPDGQDLLMYGRYQCPECGRKVTVPEYMVGLMIPNCIECEVQRGKTVQHDFLENFWDVDQRYKDLEREGDW
ncbi:hypothetical protein [Kroppenstedtia eburnea]|uniref:Uncharacterized protein n=1 Tax=Kroppenstedtia eburnea TaxID=714067 RepID=A0A1N7JGJ7_9BACL|nr:hypothetical protein [Kroppenstedtia eburnea]QKI80566.1 hypothetical protein GXN75_00195 [Kroppenstedtia eburnea]SIS48381.1 hypothetical protein SAMN05421790_10261 [Kroppenstedtia eburnea]